MGQFYTKEEQKARTDEFVGDAKEKLILNVLVDGGHIKHNSLLSNKLTEIRSNLIMKFIGPKIFSLLYSTKLERGSK